MSDALLTMSKDLVMALVRAHGLPPDQARDLLKRTHGTLRALQQREPAHAMAQPLTAPPEAKPQRWQNSIGKHAIICLECGSSFRQLSTRHLRVHDLDPQSYRTKYGIPSTQPLSSRLATARRRELASQIRPWEGASAKRAAAGRRTAKRTAKS